MPGMIRLALFYNRTHSPKHLKNATIQPLTLTLSPGRGNQLPSPALGEGPGVRVSCSGNRHSQRTCIDTRKRPSSDGRFHLGQQRVLPFGKVWPKWIVKLQLLADPNNHLIIKILLVSYWFPRLLAILSVLLLCRYDGDFTCRPYFGYCIHTPTKTSF